MRNSMKSTVKSMSILTACILFSFSGCGNNSTDKAQSENTTTSSIESTQPVNNQSDTNKTEDTSSETEKVVIDYGDEKAFEAALNKGDNLEGKIVQFTARDLHPDSAFGYNVVSGEHLNFVSDRNPDIKVGDTAVVRSTIIKSVLGSWIIEYEKVDNAIVEDTTIFYSDDSKDESSSEETDSISDDWEEPYKEYTIDNITYKVPEKYGDQKIANGDGNSKNYYIYPDWGMIFINATGMNLRFTNEDYVNEYLGGVGKDDSMTIGKHELVDGKLYYDAIYETKDVKMYLRCVCVNSSNQLVQFTVSSSNSDEEAKLMLDHMIENINIDDKLEKQYEDIKIGDDTYSYAEDYDTYNDNSYSATFSTAEPIYFIGSIEKFIDDPEPERISATVPNHYAIVNTEEGKWVVNLTDWGKKPEANIEDVHKKFPAGKKTYKFFGYSYRRSNEYDLPALSCYYIQLKDKTYKYDAFYSSGSTQIQTESPKDNTTTGQNNAVKKAKSYLNFTAFSRTGLIGQLEFEGFTHDEAVYGVDNCGANWNEQAAKKAQSYMDMMSMSRDRLKDQLEFEGFTNDQISYGLSAVGY